MLKRKMEKSGQILFWCKHESKSKRVETNKENWWIDTRAGHTEIRCWRSTSNDG